MTITEYKEATVKLNDFVLQCKTRSFNIALDRWVFETQKSMIELRNMVNKQVLGI